tara:strand:- start:895 stop:1080 length:186 start_codon:yes stop_codon:yes gene_type:complete
MKQRRTWVIDDTIHTATNKSEVTPKEIIKKATGELRFMYAFDKPVTIPNVGRTVITIDKHD